MEGNETELLPSFVSGKAIKHVRDNLFTAESGIRRGIPKVIVVITDGRSQDDVNKISKEMQLDGMFYIDKQNNKHCCCLNTDRGYQ